MQIGMCEIVNQKHAEKGVQTHLGDARVVRAAPHMHEMLERNSLDQFFHQDIL